MHDCNQELNLTRTLNQSRLETSVICRLDNNHYSKVTSSQSVWFHRLTNGHMSGLAVTLLYLCTNDQCCECPTYLSSRAPAQTSTIYQQNVVTQCNIAECFVRKLVLASLEVKIKMIINVVITRNKHVSSRK